MLEWLACKGAVMWRMVFGVANITSSLRAAYYVALVSTSNSVRDGIANQAIVENCVISEEWRTQVTAEAHCNFGSASDSAVVHVLPSRTVHAGDAHLPGGSTLRKGFYLQKWSSVRELWAKTMRTEGGVLPFRSPRG